MVGGWLVGGWWLVVGGWLAGGWWMVDGGFNFMLYNGMIYNGMMWPGAERHHVRYITYMPVATAYGSIPLSVVGAERQDGRGLIYTPVCCRC